MKCRNPECQAEVSPEALYCGKCGTITLSNCTVCGNSLPATGKVKCCSKCGTMITEMKRPEASARSIPSVSAESLSYKSDLVEKAGKRIQDVKASISESKKFQDVKATTAKTLHDVKTSLSESKKIKDVKASIKGISSKNWAMFVYPVFCLIYMIVIISGLSNASKSASGLIGLLLMNRLLTPLLTLMGIGTIFGIVGLLFKRNRP